MSRNKYNWNIEMPLLSIALVACFIFSSFAQDTNEVWRFEPKPDAEYDWIQLTSGEWLKGDFKVLYDYVVEFDSKELDLLEFDIDDVKQLRTRNVQTLLVEADPDSHDTIEVEGKLTVRDGKVFVTNGDEEREYHRNQIVTIADGVERRRDLWSGFASVGLNIRGGNTETVDATVMANLERRKARSRFIADYVGNFSTASEVQTANNQRLSGVFDWFLSTRFFWRTVDLEYFRDPFSNIDSQYSMATAVGYDLLHGSKTEWEVTCGGGYQYQKFISVATNEADRVDTPFFLAGTRFDVELNKRVDFLIDYSFRILNETSGTYTHHSLAKLSTELTAALDIDVSFIWDRIQNPQEYSDGTLPKQDDYQLVFSLAYDF